MSTEFRQSFYQATVQALNYTIELRVVQCGDNVFHPVLGVVCRHGIGVKFGTTVYDKPLGRAKLGKISDPMK